MPIRVISTLGLPHDEWLKARRQGLGGSDAATLMGLNPYGSLMTLYADKLGLLPEREDTFPIEFGRRFEDFVAERWEIATGMLVHSDKYMYCHDMWPFLLANIDRRVAGENAGLECKTTGRFSRTDYDDGTVLNYYAAQCQWYNAVMDFDCMYLAVLDRVTGDFRHYTIERDEAFIERMVDAARVFWCEHVCVQCPPDPDGTDACAEAMRVVYPPSRGVLDALPLTGHDGDLMEYLSISDEIKRLEQRKKAIAQGIQISMGGHTRAYTSGGVRVSWAPETRVTLDTKAIKAELPDIYQRYARSTESRPFKVVVA